MVTGQGMQIMARVAAGEPLPEVIKTLPIAPIMGEATARLERALELLAAGGTAMALLDVGELEGAGQWVDRAAATATEAPTPFRARMLEEWRGLFRAASGDAAGMRAHLERAARFASEHGLAAARC